MSLHLLVILAKALTEKANDNTFSMGVALCSSTLPVTGKNVFEMNDEDMEVGMGIHGEPGIERSKLKKAEVVVSQLIHHILDDAKVKSGDEVQRLINELDELALMNQYICYQRTHQLFEKRGIKIYKTVVGNYVTSLDMASMVNFNHKNR